MIERVDTLGQHPAGRVSLLPGFGQRHQLDGAEAHLPGPPAKLVAERPGLAPVGPTCNQSLWPSP